MHYISTIKFKVNLLVLSVPEYDAGRSKREHCRWFKQVAWCSASSLVQCTRRGRRTLLLLAVAHLFELSALSLSDGPPVCTICIVHPLLHHYWPTCLNYPQKQQAGDLVAADMEEIANRRQSGSGTLLCNISVIWATNSSGSGSGFPFQLQIDRRRA